MKCCAEFYTIAKYNNSSIMPKKIYVRKIKVNGIMSELHDKTIISLQTFAKLFAKSVDVQTFLLTVAI
jgi:hypothetical protein